MNKKFLPIILTAIGFILCCTVSFLLGKRLNTEARDDIRETVSTLGNEYSAIPENVLASIVEIDVYDENGTKTANASGFVALEPKRLVTCRHALVNMAYAVCTTEAGDTFRIDTICETDEKSDIAICVLPKDCKLNALKISEAPLRRGEGVTAIGSQFGIVNVVTRGNVSVVKDSYILFTAPVNAGSSGGVLLNNLYEVCGVVRGTYSEGQGINVAIPIEMVSKLVSK